MRDRRPTCIRPRRHGGRWLWLVLLLPSSLWAQAWSNGSFSDQDIIQFQPEYSSSPPPLAGVAADVSSLINWVITSHSTQGASFVVADKPRGQILVVAASGQIIAQSPALYGKYVGDAPHAGQTPAGEFILQKNYTDEPGYGGDVMFFWSEGGADYALHRTYRLNPGERRPQRLASATAADNRISNGCINVPEGFYDAVVGNMHGAKLFVLPETTATFNANNRGLASYYAGERSTHRFRPYAESEARPANKDPLRYW